MADHRFRLEFIVKAKSWQEIIKIFKDELGIDSGKQDASDRRINGLYVVQVWINEDKLGSAFYNKINESKNIALSYDPSAKKLRDDILDRICIVEHDLRKLLLNISDVVEDYFKIYDKTSVARIYKSNRDVVSKGDVNPITSYLTLEDEINIFSIELSPWNNKPLTANELLDVLDESNLLDDVKKILRSKTESQIVWDVVNKYILKTNTSWSDILPKLNELKDIRNKAAHFRIVTQSDQERVKNLLKEIREAIVPLRKSTQQDLRELSRSLKSPTNIFYELTKSIQYSTSSSTLLASSLQEALSSLSGPIVPNLPNTKLFSKQVLDANKTALDLARTMSNEAQKEKKK